MYFKYGKKEIEYLCKSDKKLAVVIKKIGHIYRVVDKDLFSSVVHHIIGQQISTKAQATIWQRMNDTLEKVDAENILKAKKERLQSFGMTFKKVEYIKDFAKKIKNKQIILEDIWKQTDEEAIKTLLSLKGVGVWTAEMILLFCMQRKNIFSFGDLAIHRGMRMVYHHKEITKKLFEKYKKQLNPYCSIASLYFWAVAGGAITDMKDYALKKL